MHLIAASMDSIVNKSPIFKIIFPNRLLLYTIKSAIIHLKEKNITLGRIKKYLVGKDNSLFIRIEHLE